MEKQPFLTLEDAKAMIARGEASSFEWTYPDDYGDSWIREPGNWRPNPDFDDEAAQRDPRTTVKINGIPTTPEIARQGWLLCIDPKYRHLA